MVSNVRSWLRRLPRPHALKADGQEIAVGEGRSKWRDAENTIAELGAQKLEAFNAEGALLRICMLEPDGVPEEKEDPFKDVKLQSREAEIAKLVLEATDRGALRHAEAYTIAFDKMASLVQFAMERASGLEVAWQTMLNQRAAEVGGGDTEEAVTQGLIGLMGQAQQAASKPPKPNGES